jgi:hypothetical protein
MPPARFITPDLATDRPQTHYVELRRFYRKNKLEIINNRVSPGGWSTKRQVILQIQDMARELPAFGFNSFVTFLSV